MSWFKLASKKSYIYAYVCSAVITIVMVIGIANLSPYVEEYGQLYNESQNILMSEPISINSSHESNIFYTPPHYQMKQQGDSIILINESDSALLTLYFGEERQVTKQYIDGFTANNKPTFEKVTLAGDFISDYFLVWENPDTMQVTVLLGQDDAFIIGVFDKKFSEKYISDMSYILNSFRKVK